MLLLGANPSGGGGGQAIVVLGRNLDAHLHGVAQGPPQGRGVSALGRWRGRGRLIHGLVYAAQGAATALLPLVLDEDQDVPQGEVHLALAAREQVLVSSIRGGRAVVLLLVLHQTPVGVVVVVMVVMVVVVLLVPVLPVSVLLLPVLRQNRGGGGQGRLGCVHTPHRHGAAMADAARHGTSGRQAGRDDRQGAGRDGTRSSRDRRKRFEEQK